MTDLVDDFWKWRRWREWVAKHPHTRAQNSLENWIRTCLAWVHWKTSAALPKCVTPPPSPQKKKKNYVLSVAMATEKVFGNFTTGNFQIVPSFYSSLPCIVCKCNSILFYRHPFITVKLHLCMCMCCALIKYIASLNRSCTFSTNWCAHDSVDNSSHIKSSIENVQLFSVFFLSR